MTAAAADLPGTTTISERTVWRTAAHAAREVPGVGDHVQVDADISGDRTTLEVRIPVHYPQPVRQVTDACREHLVRRTEELTGLGVSAVDITVTEFLREHSPTGRVR
ncbi:Asp23/Gls24 family envelope stress response protein [Nocardia sp. NBC_01329]|uniref:Asp23/Gls24 family envelope stress response protein n=1 Tax=Nocardia sp. NBC_01329 TaxID=2903594 RepID=UPI002E115137|nr:Asp23/Gls24 family envelope stress response protein [Nocardia sp. NBC_01329]